LNPPIASAAGAEAGPAPDFFTTGVWALFGKACPKRPLAFTGFHGIPEPSWKRPEKKLAWLRLSGGDWPPVDEIRSKFEAANITLPEYNSYWGAVVDSACNLSVACAVPPSIRASIGSWHMKEKYSDKELQRLANHWESESKEPHSLSSYLLAFADSAGEIHSVLKQAVLRTDPSDGHGPWVEWPPEAGSLQPPAPRNPGGLRGKPKRRVAPAN